MTCRVSAATAMLVLLTATPAWASNADLPRTPLLHTQEACMTVIDRTVDPQLLLTYTIPMADTCLGDDDLPGSRRHQLVALCRSPQLDEPLPQWLSHADVDAAAAGGMLPDPAPGPGDVLDLVDTWHGCSARIIADDMRRPIECTASLPGAPWDTTGLPAGAWVVQGYTFDPPLNLWRPRHGVFKIVDGPDDDPPAVAFVAHVGQVGSEDVLPLRACVDAAAGSMLRASWAPVEGGAWTDFDELAIESDGVVDLELEPPAMIDPGGLRIMLAVEVVDPGGASFRYVSPDEVVVLPGTVPPPNPPVPYDFCVEHESALEPQNCSGGTTEPVDDPTDDKPGCGCTAGTRSPALALPFVVVGLARRRRRAHGSVQAPSRPAVQPA